MSVHPPGLRGGQGGVKRGVVRMFGKPYGSGVGRTRADCVLLVRGISEHYWSYKSDHSRLPVLSLVYSGKRGVSQISESVR